MKFGLGDSCTLTQDEHQLKVVDLRDKSMRREVINRKE